MDYLREVKSEVCHQIFARSHIEPELPFHHHQVERVGLTTCEARFLNYKTQTSTGMYQSRPTDVLPSLNLFVFL